MTAARRLRAGGAAVLAPLMLGGADGPGHAPSGSVADTLTTAYDVAGVRVVHTGSPAWSRISTPPGAHSPIA